MKTPDAPQSKIDVIDHSKGMLRYSAGPYLRSHQAVAYIIHICVLAASRLLMSGRSGA